MQLKRLTASLMLISGSLLPLVTVADVFPYTPKVSVTGLGGSNASAQAEILMPWLGDNTWLWYGDLQSRYGKNDTWSGSLGSGYRRLFNNAIWGAYLFTDRNDTGLGHHFWSISPGIERLGETWDFRLNGYLPVNHKNWQGKALPANQIGIGNYVIFSGHSVSDRLVTPIKEMGRGLDTEVGYHVTQVPGLTLTGGAYHYHYHDAANITGVGARIEYAINKHMGIVLTDSYDNQQKNQIALGIRLSLGGAKSDTNKMRLQQRFTDEVKRGMGVLGSGSLVPTQNGLLITDQNQLISNKVWFFSPKLGPADPLADGTFEHPFQGIEQAYIDKAGQNAWLYAQSGEYAWHEINLQTGQTLQGRITGYTLPAQLEQRPLFHGKIGILQQNDVTVDSVRLIDKDSNNPLLEIAYADGVLIRNVLLENRSRNQSVTVGVEINDSNNIVIQDSTIASHALRDESAEAIGIFSANSNITIDNTKILADAKADASASASGISVIGVGNSLTLRNSTLVADASSGDYDNAMGIDAGYYNGYNAAENHLNIEGGIISVTANGGRDRALANGITLDTTNQSVKLSITQGTVIDVQAQAARVAEANGIHFIAIGTTPVPPNIELYADRVSISSTAIGAKKILSRGIYVPAAGTHFEVTLKNSQFKAYAISNATEEIYLDNASATAISLNNSAMHGTITNNIILANASAKFGRASSVGLELRKLDSERYDEASAPELTVSGNSVLSKALSENSNAYSAGMYLKNVRALITHNTISSQAYGRYFDLSKAYGIASNGWAEIANNNHYHIGGHNAKKQNFTDDMTKFVAAKPALFLKNDL